MMIYLQYPALQSYLKWLLMACCILLSGRAFGQQPSDSMPQAAEALDTVKLNQAERLAPRTFARAQQAYQRYIEMKREGRPDTDVQTILDRFHTALNTTTSKINQARSILASALTARNQAIGVKAETMATREYQLAENKLGDAIEKLEDNKLSDGDKLGQEAARLFRTAELTAVKIGLIGPAQTILAEARSQKAHEYAPATFAHAQSLLREIETAIEHKKNTTSDLREKAELAAYEARHALYLATKIDTLHREMTNWEGLLLEQETMQRKVAGLTGMQYLFDLDFNLPIDSVRTTIQVLQDSLRQQLSDRNAEIAHLNHQVDSLKTAFNQQQIRLASMLEQYQTDLQSRKEDLERRRRELDVDLRKKMFIDAANQAQTRFSKKEALVFREEKKVVIRLLGIDFAAGKTTIPKKAYALLDKLGDLILLYPKSTVVVEGHTDATGKDEMNMAYSDTRAASVREYLISITGISEERIVSTGYGSARPVASNKTRKGREENRRIEIVLKFEHEEVRIY